MTFGTRAIAVLGLGATLLFGSTDTGHARIEGGLLTCEVGGGFAPIISTPRDLHCVFQKVNGLSEAYAGSIRGFGLDLGITGAGVIAWGVEVETTELPPGVLAGSYAGAEAGATVVAGGEVRALIGGSQRTISLQPLSVEGDVGINVALGIAAMELRPLLRAASASPRVRAPAVGLSYAEVPHAQQAPHYGCGSYTHLMRGQTLYGLAHACGVTLDALLEANPQIADIRSVSTSALIHVPSHVNLRDADSCGGRVVLHESEALEHLAWRCGVTLHALLVANPSVRDVSVLRPGLVLAVPQPRPSASAPVRFARAEADMSLTRSERQVGGDPGRKTAQNASDAPRSEQVRFEPGKTGTSIRGRITGDETVLYTVGAEAGQTMRIALKPSNLATYFNVYEPGKGPGDQALAIGGTTGPMVPELNIFEGKLPASGTYSISVYIMRSAARRSEQSSYTLDISISALSDTIRLSPVQRDYADGLQGGPDYWEIRPAGQVGKILLRTSPSGAARGTGSVDSGTVLRNLGCRMNEGRRWCHVETLSSPTLSGWAPGDQLRESGHAETKNSVANASSTDAGSTSGRRPGGLSFTATGHVPCARAASQPMMQCSFGVLREGHGNGTLTVFWPDGGNRVIFFKNGEPASFDRSQADGRGEMAVKRNNDLLTVQIGEQRFEIPDAVINGG